MFYDRIGNPWLRGAVDWLFSFAVAALVFFAVRGFVLRTAHVDGNSMQPTLEHGDMVILNRFAYVIGSPRVGDIVAFPYAGNPDEHYIKRIIAAEGDVVSLRCDMCGVENCVPACDENGRFFYVNGVRLDDFFSSEQVVSFGDVTFPEPHTVQDGYFFVLGDNRNGSRDSRFSGVGDVRGSDMVGRASLRIWPLGRLGSVN